ncbi:MAG: flippase-like domain-containing protein [Planctomycetes bacterium]|nr:flippase-like domain-containing protein [Planctomycetota bacterium]
MTSARIKTWAIGLLKYGVSLGIIAYLIYGSWGDLKRLVDEPKHWGMLAAAWACCFLGVVLTIVRWRLLVLALDMPFTHRDALRLGFLGYLFNFVSLGAVGGDLVKAVVLAREQPKRGSEAAATVIVDRAMGLYALFLFASFFIVLFGYWQSPQSDIRVICRGTLIATAVGTLILAVLASPGPIRRWLVAPSHGGHIVRRLIGALGMYRRNPRVLAEGMLYSLGVHGAFTVGLYFISQGLPGVAPTLAEHFVIIPLANVTGVLPLPVNGLGAFEGVLGYLYQQIPTDGAVAASQGLLVALVYRVITISIAAVGVAFYLSNRNQLSMALQEGAASEAAAEAALEEMSQTSAANSLDGVNAASGSIVSKTMQKPAR